MNHKSSGVWKQNFHKQCFDGKHINRMYFQTFKMAWDRCFHYLHLFSTGTMYISALISGFWLNGPTWKRKTLLSSMDGPFLSTQPVFRLISTICAPKRDNINHALKTTTRPESLARTVSKGDRRKGMPSVYSCLSDELEQFEHRCCPIQPSL